MKRGRSGRTAVATLILTLAVTAAARAQATPPTYPSSKISGLVFGDYYSFTDHHDPEWDGQHGFWIRRAYLTYEHTFSEKLYARFRLEANSNGQLAGGNLVPFVKDLFLRWQYHGEQQVVVGLQPTPTFDWFETFWGLRHVEKTPADLYRLDTSRDLALGFSGPIGGSGFRYAAQIGNDSGNGAEVDQFKIVRFEGRYEKKPGLVAEAFYSFGGRPDGTDRVTAQGVAGYQGKSFRLAAQYLYQKRKSGTAQPDLEIDVWSGFAVWQVRPDKAALFARLDSVKSRTGGVQAGLPGADGIDYLALSPDAPFKAFIGGFEYFLHPSVRLAPNVEWIRYDDSAPAVSSDVAARLTFSWSW
jgi:hypothetical protein